MTEEKQKKKENFSYMKYAGLGFEFMACILVFLGIGHGLDVWMESEKHWFLLGSLVFGCVAAIYLLIKRAS